MVRALGITAAVIMVVAGCGSESEPPAAEPPPIVVPTFATLKPATDCSHSDLRLPDLDDEGVLLEVSTDDSGTSLLLKNTGTLSILVIPDAGWTTRLTSAPHANPTDAVSKAALIAVNRAGGHQAVTELPAGLPPSQVVVVPPQWAVCGLTDDVTEIASLRYLRDKMTSAEYFVATALADQLKKRSAKKTSQTLLRCARHTQRLLTESPSLQDIELYTELLNADNACRSSFKAQLSNDERATQVDTVHLLNRLERSPKLLENTQPLLALAHR